MQHGLLLLILSATGFSAGIIDTLAGGGGLITLPVLLATGLPPITALGTNKLQGVIGEMTASLRFLKHRKFQIKKIALGLICVIISSSLGTLLVQRLPATLLQKAIPFLLLAIVFYIIFSPRWLKKSHTARLSEKTFYILLGSILGFYNGFFGPATGALWTFSFIFFLNYSIVEATIYTKPLNAISNVASLFWFISNGDIYYPYVLVMAVGQVFGAYLGAHWVIVKGHWLIRPTFITIVSIMTIMLFWQYY